MDNVDKETGISYGVYQGNHYPELLDEITTNGESLTFQEAKEEVVQKVVGAIQGILEDNPETPKDVAGYVRDAARDTHFRPARLFDEHDAKELMEKLNDLPKDPIPKDHGEGHEEIAREIVEEMENRGLWDHCEFEEENYTYVEETELGPVHYEVLWLGGSPLIYVTKSPWVVHCRHCSPCVPNAGDGDSPVRWGSGTLSYSLDPEFYEGKDKGKVRVLAEVVGQPACG